MQAKERFNKMTEQLTELSTKFSNNLLDSTKAYSKLLTTKAEAAGLPQSALALLAQKAKAEGHKDATAEAGPWLVTLDPPSYLPVQVHCSNRGVREEVYRAFVTRASSGDSDNTQIISKILRLRKERAKLLGYEHHAAVSMACKVAFLVFTGWHQLPGS
jgi:oligopeptidase A